MPLLFSYGSLQQDSVQMSTFGRLLSGERDGLPGYEASMAGPNANARFTGGGETLPGVVFEITDAELAAADEYEEPDSYTRRQVTLASGKQAWVYTYTGVAD
ncbi:MAG: gamma-glutamylcyclotransferase [Acidobacteria bacterium]|nr:gamma-glutamylcyclotransferase [Acidobacteriota bacterium]